MLNVYGTYILHMHHGIVCTKDVCITRAHTHIRCVECNCVLPVNMFVVGKMRKYTITSTIKCNENRKKWWNCEGANGTESWEIGRNNKFFGYFFVFPFWYNTKLKPIGSWFPGFQAKSKEIQREQKRGERKRETENGFTKWVIYASQQIYSASIPQATTIKCSSFFT